MGRIRVNGSNSSHAFLTPDASQSPALAILPPGSPAALALKNGGDVFIKERALRNRAYDGDLVAVRIDPVESWSEVKLSGDKGGIATRPTGEVVHIAQAAHTPVVTAGFLKAAPASNARYLEFVSADNKVYHANFQRSEWPAEIAADPTAAHIPNMLLKMEYLPWDARYPRPNCRLVGNLGSAGSIEAETEALLTNCDIDYDHSGKFSPEVEAEVAHWRAKQEAGWTIPAEELAVRRDFRRSRIVSIDPLTARDLDDALSIEPLPNGTYRVGVHIADVSHFVKPGTKVDEEARHRGTSVYLVGRVIPMLPRVLCEHLCSLNPSVDRLSYSCVFDINLDGTLVERSPWFGKSVMRSCCKLDYGTAQLMVDTAGVPFPDHPIAPSDELAELTKAVPSSKIKEPYQEGCDPIPLSDADKDLAMKQLWSMIGPGGAKEPSDGVTPLQVCEDVRLLHRIGMARRKTRFATGSLSLNETKLIYRLDKEGNPVDFFAYDIKDTNRLVEEFMLLANELVARKCAMICPDFSLIRRHPAPKASMEKVTEFITGLGLKFCADSAGDMHNSLQAFFGKFFLNGAVVDEEVPGSIPVAAVLQSVCTRPMEQAKYCCSSDFEDVLLLRHYALNFDLYTHFTSPIRRYADLIVHRVLTRAIESSSHGDLFDDDDDEARRGGQVAAASSSSGRGEADAQQHLDDNMSAGLNAADVSSTASHCNDRKVNAKKAGDLSGVLYLLLLLRQRIDRGAPGLTDDEPAEPAVLTDMGDKSFKVTMLRLGGDHFINLDQVRAQSNVKEASLEKFDGDESAAAAASPDTAFRRCLAIKWSTGQADSRIPLFGVIPLALGVSKTTPLTLVVRILPSDGSEADFFVREHQKEKDAAAGGVSSALRSWAEGLYRAAGGGEAPPALPVVSPKPAPRSSPVNQPGPPASVSNLISADDY